MIEKPVQVAGQLWLDDSRDDEWHLKLYDGSRWVALGAVFIGNLTSDPQARSIIKAHLMASIEEALNRQVVATLSEEWKGGKKDG